MVNKAVSQSPIFTFDRIPHQRKKWFLVILIPNCKTLGEGLYLVQWGQELTTGHKIDQKNTAYKNRSALLLTVLFSVVLTKTGVIPEARKEFMVRTNNSKKEHFFFFFWWSFLSFWNDFSHLEILIPTQHPISNHGQIMQFNNWECFPQVLYTNFPHSSLSLKATQPLFNRVNSSFLLF